MSLKHTSQVHAIRNGGDVVAEDGTYSKARTNHNPSRGEKSDDLSSLLRETSIVATHYPYTSNYAPPIRNSNLFHIPQTTYIIPDSHEHNETRVQVNERDEQPQGKSSNHRLKLPSLHLHLHHRTVEDSEKQHVVNLQRGRDAALSAECDRIAEQRIDPTRGSIRGLFGRGRHRDAWLIGRDTDATDFGSKVEGKIDAGRSSLSSSGTGRDKLVGTVAGREKLAREQEMNINNLLAAKDCYTRRRSRSSGGESPTVGRSVTGVARSLDEPEVSGGNQIDVVRIVQE